MKKKFICTVCGYIHEGTEAPEQCPICKADKSKFKEMEVADDELKFATVHYLGAAYKEGVSEELIQHCKETFAGECSEVGMYLAMARQADREGYPEIARAYEHYAYEEANHASRYAELLGEVLADTKANLTPLKSSPWRSCRTLYGLPLQKYSLPSLRSEPKSVSSSKGKLRSSTTLSNSCPTAPLAPTIAICILCCYCFNFKRIIANFFAKLQKKCYRRHAIIFFDRAAK